MNIYYIPHSLINSLSIAVDTSSSNAGDVICIKTKEGDYYTRKEITTDTNGINGDFEKR